MRKARTHGPDRSQPLDFGHLPVVNPKGEPNFAIFSNSRCGPIISISTRIGAYENQHLVLLNVDMAFSIEVGFGFLFSIRAKTENRKFSKFQIGPEMPQHHPKEQKKHPEPQLGLFFRST